MSVLRGQCCIKCNHVTAICVKIFIMWGTVLRGSVCGAPVLAMSAPDAVPMQGTGRDPNHTTMMIGLNTARVHICRPIHNTSASCHELVAARYPEQVDRPARRVPDAGIPHCTRDNMQPAIHTLCTAMSTPWVSPCAYCADPCIVRLKAWGSMCTRCTMGRFRSDAPPKATQKTSACRMCHYQLTQILWAALSAIRERHTVALGN